MFRTRTPGNVHLRHLHAVHVQRRELQRVRGASEPAAPVLPRSGQHRQAAKRAKLHRAVAMMLDADQRPQQRRLRRRVFARESFDVFCRQAHRVWHAFRRVLPHAFRERVVTDRVLRNVVVIDQAVADDDVHHRQRQRRVTGRLDLNVPVGRLRGARPDRIDHHDLRAAALRFAHERPEMEVGDDRVRSPQHDVAAVDDLFGIDSRSRPDRRRKARARPPRRRCSARARCSPSNRTGACRARPSGSAPARPPSCTAGSLPRPIRR